MIFIKQIDINNLCSVYDKFYCKFILYISIYDIW